MWRTRRAALDRGERVSFETADGALSWGAALTALGAQPAFRALVLDTLRATPLAAFWWETPPVSAAGLARAFEWVALDAPGLARPPADPAPFAAVLAAGDGPVTAFENLGRDAVLVAPRAVGPADARGHIAAFVRRAPPDQAHALLVRVAAEAQRLLDDRPLWISTSGAGVAWLHVRLDRTPKYYQHPPYRTWAAP